MPSTDTVTRINRLPGETSVYEKLESYAYAEAGDGKRHNSDKPPNAFFIALDNGKVVFVGDGKQTLVVGRNFPV